MMSMRLFALAIDEVRGIFGAPEDVATALRAIAASRFAPKVRPAPGLLGKLGPVLLRAPDAPVVQPGAPIGTDVDAVLSGAFVRPDRLAPSWLLVETWIEAMSWGQHRDDLAETELNAIDFDLAKVGVPPSLGLRALVAHSWGVTLTHAPGLVAGYVTSAHVDSMRSAWETAADDLDEAHRERVREYLAWFDKYPQWREAASAGHRPEPDLVAILRTTA